MLDNLWITLLRALPSSPTTLPGGPLSTTRGSQSIEFGAKFPLATLLAYDVAESKAGMQPSRLGTLESDAGLAGMPVPTFVLPSPHSGMTTLFGSCRKLHGKGKDAATEYFSLLSRVVRSTVGRPSMLLLTGDQIYADDVSDVATPLVTELAHKLDPRSKKLQDPR